MLFLTAMIVARFFDSDLSLIFKGIVFILLGIGFLSVNMVMSKQLNAASKTKILSIDNKEFRLYLKHTEYIWLAQ